MEQCVDIERMRQETVLFISLIVIIVALAAIISVSFNCQVVVSIYFPEQYLA